jgi:hypothetical protein
MFFLISWRYCSYSFQDFDRFWGLQATKMGHQNGIWGVGVVGFFSDFQTFTRAWYRDEPPRNLVDTRITKSGKIQWTSTVDNLCTEKCIIWYVNDISYNDIYIYIYKIHILYYLCMDWVLWFLSNQRGMAWWSSAFKVCWAPCFASPKRPLEPSWWVATWLTAMRNPLSFVGKVWETRYTMAWQTMGTMGSLVNGGL